MFRCRMWRPCDKGFVCAFDDVMILRSDGAFRLGLDLPLYIGL